MYIIYTIYLTVTLYKKNVKTVMEASVDSRSINNEIHESGFYWGRRVSKKSHLQISASQAGNIATM